jgi:hypothetical protein
MTQQEPEAKMNQKAWFLELANRLTQSTDPKQQKRLKAELARLTFGD